MREILTVLAGLLVAVLVAMLAIPPFIDWTAHRQLVERAIGRAIGQEVRTEGRLDIRLLPSARIRVGRMTIGSPAPNSPSLDAIILKADIPLPSLLSGEIRLRNARIGRAEIKLPAAAGDDWRVPRRLLASANLGRPWVFEEVLVRHLFVTVVDPRTGRTDQAVAEHVRLEASSLAGPWRLTGTARARSFELALGEVAADAPARLKLVVGSGDEPRLDLDGKLEFEPGPGETLVPRFTGTGRLATGAPGSKDRSRPSWRTQAAVAASGRAVTLSDIAIEAGEAGEVRLAGEGRYDIQARSLGLSLAGRRLHLPALWAGAEALARPEIQTWLPPPDLRLALELRLDSLGVGADEDLTAVRLRALSERGRLAIQALEAAGPGDAALRSTGEIALASIRPGSVPDGSGQVVLSAARTERFGQFLASLGFSSAPAILDGQPLQLSADLTIAAPLASLRNLRVSIGEAQVSGAVRYTGPEAGARARVDAQLALDGIDVASLREGRGLLAAAGDVDLGLTVEARRVTYGSARGGRISGRITTEGSAVLVEQLQVRDLAGAEADLSGRISAGGSGRIEGRLRAKRAAPLLDLFGPTWIGGLVAFVPEVVRESGIDLALGAERAPGTEQSPSAFRTSLEGRLGGGPFAAETTVSDGLLTEMTANASVEDGSAWLGTAARKVARRPASVQWSGRRGPDGRLAFELKGDVAGLRLATAQPVRLGPEDDRVDGGEVEIAAADASSLLPVVGMEAPAPTPLQLTVTFDRSEALNVRVAGRVLGEQVSADLSAPSRLEVSGRLRVARLNVPWLLSTVAGAAPAAGGTLWPGTRFSTYKPWPILGSVKVESGSVTLAPGFVGAGSFVLQPTPEGLRLGEIDLGAAGGRVRGDLSLLRQGGLASLIVDGSAHDVPLASILGGPFGPGRLSASLKFGGSGESVAALVANLGGAGEIALTGVAVARADPGAPGRVAQRVLRSDDPLASARWQALLAEELDRGPMLGGPIQAPASLVAGSLRMTPLRIETPGGVWEGSATVELRTLALETRGTLESATAPRIWKEGRPAILLGWSGPLSRPSRTVDPAPLVNGIAAVVLARELDRIENFELDLAEQRRRNSRVEMDRQRRLAAEEAARQARLKAEAEERARQEAERLRQEQEERARQEAEERQRREVDRQRRETERQRRDAERRRQEAERRAAEANDVPSPPPVEIRPPAQRGFGN